MFRKLKAKKGSSKKKKKIMKEVTEIQGYVEN